MSYMENFTVLVDRGEDGYLLSDVVELPSCHTQVSTIDELMIRTREAISLFIETNKSVRNLISIEMCL